MLVDGHLRVTGREGEAIVRDIRWPVAAKMATVA